MKIDGPLIKAEFVSRPNRFITLVKIGNKVVRSHLPDPGRLKELLIPGVELLVKKAQGKSDRKTDYTTVMVKTDGIFVSLVSALPNKFVSKELEKRSIPFLSQYKMVKAEVMYGGHRFDFLLKNNSNEQVYLEVKSVTFVENGTGKFPDAVTTRGASHVKTLTQISRNGGNAAILFVCQRHDVDRFEPMWNIDPLFSTALFEASEAGVMVRCISTKVTEMEMTFYREIPVYLEPL